MAAKSARSTQRATSIRPYYFGNQDDLRRIVREFSDLYGATQAELEGVVEIHPDSMARFLRGTCSLNHRRPNELARYVVEQSSVADEANATWCDGREHDPANYSTTDFGKWLRAYRHARRMPTRHVAYHAGLESGHISRLELSPAKPQSKSIIRINEALERFALARREWGNKNLPLLRGVVEWFVVRAA